jgi:hypothetical protein
MQIEHIAMYVNDIDIKPIAKSREHFMKWVENYPFYSNVNREGVKLFEAA